MSLVDSRLALPVANAHADADAHLTVVGELDSDRTAMIAALVQACAGSTSCELLNLSGVSELTVVGVTTCLRVLQDHAHGAASTAVATGVFELALLRTVQLPQLSFAMASPTHRQSWLSAVWPAPFGVHAGDPLPLFSTWWDQAPSCGPLSADGQASVWSDIETRWVWTLGQALSPVQLTVDPLQNLDCCFGARMAK